MPDLQDSLSAMRGDIEPSKPVVPNGEMLEAEYEDVKTSLVPLVHQPVTVPAAEYELEVVEIDHLQHSKTTKLRLTDVKDWRSEVGILSRAFIAKQGDKRWMNKSIPEILRAIVFADELNLSFEQGDVYDAGNGLSTTAQAKIKYAIRQRDVKDGLKIIQSYRVETYELDTPFKMQQGLRGVSGGGTSVETKDLETKVSVTVKDWPEPFIYTARLSEWFMATNPNWTSRPRYMLEQNALSKALMRVCPMGGAEDDEAPPQSATASQVLAKRV